MIDNYWAIKRLQLLQRISFLFTIALSKNFLIAFVQIPRVIAARVRDGSPRGYANANKNPYHSLDYDFFRCIRMFANNFKKSKNSTKTEKEIEP